MKIFSLIQLVLSVVMAICPVILIIGQATTGVLNAAGLFIYCVMGVFAIFMVKLSYNEYKEKDK